MSFGQYFSLPLGYSQQDEFLDLLERLLPSEWWEPLRDPGPGGELLDAMADLGQVLSYAVGRFDDDAHMLTAGVAGFAEGEVLFYRQAAGAGAVIVKAGTIVGTSNGDRRFILLDDVQFGIFGLGPYPGRVQAEAAAWEYNVRGRSVCADGTVLPGEIDTVVTPIQDPPFGDPTIKVRQDADLTGGRPDALGQLGADRGVARRGSESADHYRRRVRRLPDVVSPAAMRRIVQAHFAPLGYSATVIETWEETYQTCWDADVTLVGAPDPNLFVYDHPQDPLPFRNRWLDEQDHRGAFIVVCPNLAPMEDVSFVYDDAAMVEGEYSSAIGRRAVCAHDLDRTHAGLLPAYDGHDAPKEAVYASLWDVLQESKAGGVHVALELEGN